MEHPADVGADAVLNVVKGSMVPVRMAGIAPEGLRRRIHPEEQQIRGDQEESQARKGSHGSLALALFKFDGIEEEALVQGLGFRDGIPPWRDFGRKARVRKRRSGAALGVASHPPCGPCRVRRIKLL